MNENNKLIEKYNIINELAWEAAIAFDNGKEIPECPFADKVDIELYNKEFKRLINCRNNR